MGLLLGQVSKWRAQRADRGAHAARGFVGGAAFAHSAEKEVHHGFNAARGFVGGAALILLAKLCGMMMFQCRTRLCGWCSLRSDGEELCPRG